MQNPPHEESILAKATLSYNGLMKLPSMIFYVFLLLFSMISYSQDELFYQKILGGDFSETHTIPQVMEFKFQEFKISSAFYRFDIDEDGKDESISSQKRDGVDWIEIKNSAGEIVFEKKLLAMGVSSTLYKVKIVSISPRVKALILFLDEGAIRGKKVSSTARIFVLTVENNDLSKIWFSPGPHFFTEYESLREQYWRRNYNVNVYDVNGDGVKEIAVMFNHIQRYMIYEGKGNWRRF